MVPREGFEPSILKGRLFLRQMCIANSTTKAKVGILYQTEHLVKHYLLG